MSDQKADIKEKVGLLLQVCSVDALSTMQLMSEEVFPARFLPTGWLVSSSRAHVTV